MNFKSLIKTLYFQVIIGIICGILVGYFFPSIGLQLEPLGTEFIKLIKMLITPIIFGTIVVGIVKIRNLRTVGRIGVKALIYFEVMTTIALIIGIIVVEIIQPGNGIVVNHANLNGSQVSQYATAAANNTGLDFVMNIVPTTVFSGFVTGDILQVLFISILFSIGLLQVKDAGEQVLNLIETVTQVFFKIINMIMYLAPIGAFGAMGYTIALYGIGTIENLALLVVCVYVTCILFVLIGLGLIARYCGFSIWKFILYIKEEFFLVLGTSSSEVALPRIIKKLENAGCEKSVVGLVIPTGYSFNLDGTCIYLTIATFFIFQAFNVPMSFGEKLLILGILLITSKGAAAVTGGGFIVLSATLAAFPQIPIEALALILGVDRFLSEVRAITNLIGNSVATIFVSKWENLLDKNKLKEALNL